MKHSRHAHAYAPALALMVGACLLGNEARAGNEANFVLYDHHTDEKGETEINVFSDFSNAVSGDPHYAAQLFEIERALTDRWETALYLEGDKIDGEGYDFAGWRLESRYRLFEYGTLLNPVLYVEYENLKTDHKYLLEVTGRTDTPEGACDDEARDREQAHRRPRHYQQVRCRFQLDQRNERGHRPLGVRVCVGLQLRARRRG